MLKIIAHVTHCFVMFNLNENDTSAASVPPTGSANNITYWSFHNRHNHHRAKKNNIRKVFLGFNDTFSILMQVVASSSVNIVRKWFEQQGKQWRSLLLTLFLSERAAAHSEPPNKHVIHTRSKHATCYLKRGNNELSRRLCLLNCHIYL